MSIEHLSNFWLILIFLFSAIVIWFAGMKISITLDDITKHFNIGEALGGVIFLAVVTNLPEIAITAMAAYNGHIEIASSNILGGIAIQTVVLVFVDVFGVGKANPLTYVASSIELVIEGIILIVILNLVLMGHYISTDLIFFRITPFELLILISWMYGIYLLSKTNLPKLVHEGEAEIKKIAVKEVSAIPAKSIGISIFIFVVCAVLTLISGLMLEMSSEVLSVRFGMSGAFFGATILAAATALPEVSTGIASAKISDYRMAVSDILGGNAFLPVLFLLASIISGKAILPSLEASDLYLTGLGILLTSIYIIGLIFRLPTQYFRMGVDSLLVLLLYILGILGLFYVG